MNENTELTPVEELQKQAQAIADFYTQPFAQAINAMAEAITNSLPAIRDACHKLAAAIVSAKISIWTLAEVWAEDAHPEWLAIYYRTKKARIRKKYRDRIIRAYMDVRK